MTLGGSIELQNHKKDKEALKSVRELRNDIMHYEFEIDVNEAEKKYNYLFQWLRKVQHARLNIKMQDVLDEELLQITNSIEEAVDQIKARLMMLHENGKIPEHELLICPQCIKQTFVIMDNEDICFTCGHIDNVVECANCGELVIEDNTYEDPRYEDVRTEYLADWGYAPGICEACLHEAEKLEYEDYNRD